MLENEYHGSKANHPRDIRALDAYNLECCHLEIGIHHESKYSHENILEKIFPKSISLISFSIYVLLDPLVHIFNWDKYSRENILSNLTEARGDLDNNLR